jgi:MFS family permease
MIPAAAAYDICSCYSVFFVDYALVAMIVPFFPKSEAGIAVGSVATGLVFSSYLFAMASCTPLAPVMLKHLGIRNGMLFAQLTSAAAALLFGLAPVLVGLGSPVALSAVMIGLRSLGGFAAGVSEAGALALLSNLDSLGAHLGKLMAGQEVIIGISQSMGFVLGGVLYEVGDRTPFGAFLCPFVGWLCLATPASLLLLHSSLLRAPPARSEARSEVRSEDLTQLERLVQETTLHDETRDGVLGAARPPSSPETTPPGMLSIGFLVVVVACMMTGAIDDMLSPVVEPRLKSPPYDLTGLSGCCGSLIAAQ